MQTSIESADTWAAHRSLMASFVGLALLLWACGGQGGSAPESDAPEASPKGLRALLVEGATHAEIQQWPQALELFQQATALAPEEPVAWFNMAVVHFHTGDVLAARKQLARIPETAPPWLQGRAAYLRGKLATEEGDRTAVQAAYAEAVRLDPDEAVYPYALAEFQSRQPKERGMWLERAYALWPENARVAADFALWALRQGDAEMRSRGLAAVETLAAAAPNPKVDAYLQKGRAEIDLHPDQGRVPPPLRIVLNLMLNGKRFRGDVSELMARQAVAPFTEPVATPPPPPETSPTVRFEPAAQQDNEMGLPQLPLLADGERVIGVVLVDDAVDEEPSLGRESALALLSDRALYFLPQEGDAFERLAELPTEPLGLVAGDLDDDGRVELAVATDDGLQLWAREGGGGNDSTWREHPVVPELTAVGGLRELLLLDFEHDGDLDLLALNPRGQAVLVTHRGEAGWGPPDLAPLPTRELPIERLASTDLDGDADQDLLATTATELLVLRNWRQGEFSLHSRMPLPASAQQLISLDYDGDGMRDVVVRHPTGLTFWRGNGTTSLARDTTAEESAAPFINGKSLHQVASADIDLDGDPDLLVAEDAGIVLLQNLGESRLTSQAGLVAGPPQPILGILPLDLDGDHDQDLLAWDKTTLHDFRGSGAEDQGWITVSLRGLAGKVPLDGHGVRLEVMSAHRTQVLEPGRPNVTLGLGGENPAVIKATWPNGISEYLFNPVPRARHKLQLTMRIEGSCPFLYASDGENLRFVTDILGLAPLGMLAAPGRYVPADPEEYLRLPDWVRPRDGELKLAITEELREVAYLDQVELVVVDAPEDVVVMNGEQWLKDPVEGLALRLLTPLRPPVALRDHLGNDALELGRQEDQRYLAPLSGKRRYQGAMEPHHFEVELPAEITTADHPALVMVGWLHWGNTSTNVARAQDPEGAPLFPYLEVGDGRGGWQRTATAVGLPAGKTKPVVVDLTGVVHPADPRLRVTTDFEVYWDLIATASLRPESSTEHRIHRLPARSAQLRYGGFSRWYRASAQGPYLFDYSDRRPYPWREDEEGHEVLLSWQEHEGYYTAFGGVEKLLRAADDQYVVFGSGEEVDLRFDLTTLPSLPPGWQRTFFVHNEGWEKDGDPNVACSQTVLPLPTRGMVGYPCEETTAVQETAVGPVHDGAPRTRWVPRHRLTRRLTAWANRPE